MKLAKKITFTFLALLPLLGIVILCLTSFNAKTETYPMHSRVRFTYSPSDGTGWLQFDNPEAVNARMLGAMFSDRYNSTEQTTPTHAEAIGGVLLSAARLADKVSATTGIPITFTMATFWYMLYLAVIEIAMMIMSIVTFIPRKCGEIFERS